MRYLFHLEEKDALDPGVVGHKFASLAKAHGAGLTVPPAVAVGVDAHRFHAETGRWPEGLPEEILEEARKLGLSEGLSVRSSATCEDLETRSFAGQYKTFLDVREEKDIQDRIEKCWASARELDETYLRIFRESHPGCAGEEHIALMGVVIQRMVHAAAAGVAFSKNPLYSGRDEVVIEATAGVAEELVSGRVTPCRVFVQDNRVVRMEDPQNVHGSLQDLLEERKWLQIAMLARKAEEIAGGKPQDIEWAVDPEGTLWLLQSRAITTFRDSDLAVPTGVWTRKIANDLWADRLTTFMADTMLKNTDRFNLSTISNRLGIPVVKPSLSIIHGFLYVNCESLKQVLSFIPPRFRTTDLRRLFPPGYPIDDVPPPSLVKAGAFLLRWLLLCAVDRNAHPLLSRRATLRELERISKRLDGIRALPDNTPCEALTRLQAAVESMAMLQETNQWPYCYATLFTWALRWLAVDVGGLQQDDFLQLLRKGAGNVTIEIEAELRRIAAAVGRDERAASIFRKNLRDNPPTWAIDALPAPIRREVELFLQKYGVRSRQRTLYVKRWAEAPEEVLRMIALLMPEPVKEQGPTGKKAGEASSHAQGLPMPKVSTPLRPILYAVLHLARTFLDLREELRFFLDRILFLIRQSLLALGRATGLGESAMFLTEAELSKVVSGEIHADEARALADRRAEEFKGDVDVYTFYVDGRPVEETPSEDGILQGVGTSPGRTTGSARIVHDPSQASVRKGDILVARNVDPGWTPILSMVSGLIVEEGGILNHSSIVARELGIPAITGVRGAVQRISEGSIITMDGNLGTVHLEADKGSV